MRSRAAIVVLERGWIDPGERTRFLVRAEFRQLGEQRPGQRRQVHAIVVVVGLLWVIQLAHTGEAAPVPGEQAQPA